MASGNNDFSSPAPPPAAPPAVRSRRPKPPPPVGSLRPVAARTARPRPPPAEGTSAGAAGTATAAPRSASIRPAAASRPTPNYYGASNTPASPSAGATTAAAPQGMYGSGSRPVATASASGSGSGSGGMFMNPAGASGAPAPAAATAAAATASNSYYGSQPQQQPAAATTTHDAHDDWYSETPATSTSAPTSSSLYTQQQPQQPQQQQQFQQQQFQQQQQQQPQVKAMNPYATSQYAQAPAPLEGSMQPSLFMPTAASGPTAMNPYANDNDGTLDNTWNDNNNNNSSNNHANAPIDDDIHNEPPLLEELGINLGHIMMKTKAVVIPSQRWSGQNSALTDPALIVQDADLAGPLAFALLLGGELLLTGKIHFGYIYGFGLFGCLAMTLVLNLMSPQQAVSVWTVTSILGYSLLPVNILAAAKILLVNIANLSTLGRVLGVLTVLWSTTASTRLLEVGCGMRDQRYLIAYPIALLYSAFVLITIF
jgi:hypothetical protein